MSPQVLGPFMSHQVFYAEHSQVQRFHGLISVQPGTFLHAVYKRDRNEPSSGHLRTCAYPAW